MEGQRLAFMRVSVAGAPAVEFCVDLETDDPYTTWFLGHDWIDEPVQRAFLNLVEPHCRVLDLGCHLGTFSLPAAALGAEVIALDADPMHVDLVRRAAQRNGFERLHVVHGAVSDSDRPVDFIERSIHGRLWVPDDSIEPTVPVQPVVVDDLFDQHGWDAPDVIKLDIEGAELTALNGMRRMLARGARPALVFECNDSTLPLFGASTTQLRTAIAELGYELLLIDHLRPGVLVEMATGSVQPEAVSDYLAITARTKKLVEQWRIAPPFGLEQTVTRVLNQASSEAAGYRRLAAELLVDGPDWLRSHPLTVPAIRALELDDDPAVCAAFNPDRTPSAAAEQRDVREPESTGRPDGIAVLAESLALRTPSAERERQGGPCAEELLIRDTSFHLMRGELLGVVADDQAAASGLLRAVAGFDRPLDGRLLAGPAAFLPAPESMLEPTLSIGENIVLLAAYLGAHAGETTRRIDELAELAGLGGQATVPLRKTSSTAALRLVVAVALECADAEVLLVDELPPLEDDEFARWAQHRAAERRGGGTAMLQVGSEHGWPLGSPQRVLWIEDGLVTACGHGESIFKARRAGKLEPVAG